MLNRAGGVGGTGSTQPVTKGGRLLFYEYEVGLSPAQSIF